MSVKDSMDAWGREFLRQEGHTVADDADIQFSEDNYDIGYCETCSYIVYVVDVSDGVNTARYEGDMGELIREMNGGGY